MEFELMLTPREKSPLPKMSPEDDRICDAVDSEPKHYQLSYSGPEHTFIYWHKCDMNIGEMERGKCVCLGKTARTKLTRQIYNDDNHIERLMVQAIKLS